MKIHGVIFQDENLIGKELNMFLLIDQELLLEDIFSSCPLGVCVCVCVCTMLLNKYVHDPLYNCFEG